MDDHELLREYVRSQSQDAFSELVGRHLPMVYSAARRMLQDAQLAEDVAQRAFTVLAEKAATLSISGAVAGWLYNTTRYLAMHAVRNEQRRREREQSAVAMQALQNSQDITPILDELEPAMAELDAPERDVLVLRFFESRSLREVGQALGISEDAARMRVNRSIERLRNAFARHGITVSSVLLTTALTTGTTTALPTGLATTIAASTVAGAAALTATPTMLNLIFNTKALPVILGAAILTGTTTCLVQQRQLLRLRSENQNLLAQEQPLRAEHETATKRAEATQEQLARLQRDNSELLRLRNEVGQLRRELETAKQKAPPPSSIGQSGANAGRYLSKEELAFAGYATPEAALQSMTWAMLNGNYEQTVASMSPEIQQHREPDDREQFEKRTKIFAPLVKGIQILARKRLAEGKVELKMRMDTDSAPGLRKMEAVIQPMVKLGDEWKLSGSSREYKESWDQDGQVEALVP